MVTIRHTGDGWTITHGFFAIMGGFMEYDGNQPIRVLLPEELESYSLTGNGNFPRLSIAEIEDKSKGDAISKGVVILQTGWFITQFIVRVVQGLPISELELATVALAVLNFVIYLLWWEKPQNVRRGVRVYKKRTTEEPDDGNVEATVGFLDALEDAIFGLPDSIARGPVTDDFKDSPWLIRVLIWPLFKPVDIIFPGRNAHDTVSVKRVNTFYPHKWDTNWLEYSIVVVAAITLAFGGIHCFGWSFDFPSSTEQLLWRVASISIIEVPFMFFPARELGRAIDRYLDPTSDIYTRVIPMLLLLLYTLGRLALLVLSFLCLRSLPPAVFHVIDWSSFIPHV